MEIVSTNQRMISNSENGPVNRPLSFILYQKPDRSMFTNVLFDDELEAGLKIFSMQWTRN